MTKVPYQLIKEISTGSHMNKKVLVPISDGSEEIEVCSIVNVLRRGGIDVTLASIRPILKVTGSREIQIVADKLLSDCVDDVFDMIILPGGMPGAEYLRDSRDLTLMLEKQAKENRLYGAICASPAVVLAHHGLLAGKKATAYPAFQKELPDKSTVNQVVVIDGNCITGQSPGTAIEFSLRVLEVLSGTDIAQKIRHDLQIILEN
jgi:protein deglycase